MTTEVASETQRGGHKGGLQLATGLVVGLALFLAMNWLTSYQGRHAPEGRQIAALALAAFFFGLIGWLAARAPRVGMSVGITICCLVFVGLAVWSPAFLTIPSWSLQPRLLLSHGASELLIWAFAAEAVTVSAMALRAERNMRDAAR